MDVFGAALEARAYLCDAAIAAGHELGVFEALRRGLRSLDELAGEIGVVGGHRLRALLEVLAALGAIGREPCDVREAAADGPVAGSRCAGAASVSPRPEAHVITIAGRRFVAATAVPPRSEVTRAGWGLLADVIRSDRPLPADGGDPGATRRMHEYLTTAGAAAARELASSLGSTSLLDLGSGAGAYSKAFLEANPAGRATLVDRREILELAAEHLGPLAGRARLVAGDAAEVDVGDGHGAVLLANLLHLHGPETCARLVATAARAVAPGGAVVIKDLRVDDDRTGPIEGLLFALNMAIYTEAGDIYATPQLRAWLADAGLVDLVEHRLASAPDSIVIVARKPRDSSESAARGASHASAEAIAAELDEALARTADQACCELAARGALRPEAAAGSPALAMPSALRSFLAAAVALERSEASQASAERAERMIRHYTEVMPRMHVAQIAGTDEPGATLFHAPLDWDQLPRLGTAIDRLFAMLDGAGVAAVDALGAASADAFRARAPTLATLYRRTHYGGFMPLLYGYPADLAYAYARGVADGRDLMATIDRYLTAPIVHELCHFAPGRAAIAPPHLDECIAGWLGVHVHPELAYPVAEYDDALYAAPWLSQVGQAIARAFGLDRVVRAHAGEPTALPADFVATAARLGWDDWCARRTLHFLSDTMDPAPWVALALATAAGRSLAGETLTSLAALPLADLELPDDPAFDRAIVEDGLRAMCLTSTQVGGSFRTRSRLPDGAIAIDVATCAIVAPGRGALDPVVPRYWLPPAVATRIRARGLAGYSLQLATLAAIPEAAAAICDASPGVERAGFGLLRCMESASGATRAEGDEGLGER